jgi:NADH dehydrogenase [ubiquinone] 1 alpha subcomplex assembly factor 5
MSEEIFSKKRRQLNRARARRAPSDSHWLLDRMADELVDRLSGMKLEVQHVLVVGHGIRALRNALPNTARMTCRDLVPDLGVDDVGDEDQPLGQAGSYDLVLACGTLDTLDDLPGALILIRRALRPGGLFLGAMLGAGSLSGFKALVRTTETEMSDHAALRFHPQIDVRSAGDLLFRAGFSTPVADQEDVRVTYTAFKTLIGDLRGTGANNALRDVHPMSRAVYKHLAAAIDADGWEDMVCPLYLTGWAPVAGETRPTGPVKGFL